jgi:Tol biopolymer transport system component
MNGDDIMKTAILAETAGKEQVRDACLIRGVDLARTDTASGEHVAYANHGGKKPSPGMTLKWLAPAAAVLAVTIAGIVALRLSGGVAPSQIPLGQPPVTDATHSVPPATPPERGVTRSTPPATPPVTDATQSVPPATPPVTSPTLPPISIPAVLDEISDRRGNSSGNLANLGFVAGDGEWVYYADSGDNRSIYRVKPDGSGREKLTGDEAAFINVFDGRVYYANRSDNSKIYSMNTDGSDRRKLGDDPAYLFSIEDGKVYYSNGYSIRSMNTDGSDMRVLSDDLAAQIYVEDGSLYYKKYIGPTSGGAADYYEIYSMNTDGSGKTKLSDDTYKSIDNFIVVGGTVYFTAPNVTVTDGPHDRTIIRINADGSGRAMVIHNCNGLFNATGNRVYFINLLDNSSPYSANSDGSDRRKLSDDSAIYLSIVGGRLYYSGPVGMVSVRLDGSDRRVETGAPHTVSPYLDGAAADATQP